MERESDGARWRGDFSKTYVEEVSAKTGSFKKFAVFAKMLVAAVVNESSESVSVDLLTYADLERLKRERTSRPGSARDTTGVRASAGNARDVSPASQKRYLIMTHADEFDRTHYPLPLLFEDDPSPQALQATVQRLRRENQKLRAAGGEERPRGATATPGDDDANAALGEENAALRREVARLTETLTETHGDGDTPGLVSIDALPPAYAQAERLRAEVRALSQGAVEAKRAADDAARERRGLEAALAGAEAAKRRMLAKKQRELDDAREDIARRRDVERELRTKVRDLEAQCDGLERRLRAAGGGYAPPPRAASRPASRAASAERSRPWREGPAFGRANAGPSASPRAYGRENTNTNDTRGFRTPTRYRSPSPARERAPSRGRDRAPRSPRFDPTAYVAEKRAREEARFRNSARGLASGASSPYGSRAASPSPRARGGSAAASPGGAGGHKDAKTRRAPTTRSPSPAPRGVGGGAEPARVGGGGGARARARGAGRDAGRGGNVASSPGRVLRDVQRRLTEVAAGEKAAAAKPRARGGSRVAAAKENAPADASAEIADIDSRLAALQTFLREAKSAGSPAGKEGRAAAA